MNADGEIREHEPMCIQIPSVLPGLTGAKAGLENTSPMELPDGRLGTPGAGWSWKRGETRGEIRPVVRNQHIQIPLYNQYSDAQRLHIALQISL